MCVLSVGRAFVRSRRTRLSARSAQTCWKVREVKAARARHLVCSGSPLQCVCARFPARAFRPSPEPTLLPCGHAFCADCLATPTGRGTGGCPLPRCDKRRPPPANKTGPDAATPDVIRTHRIATLRVFCQVRTCTHTHIPQLCAEPDVARLWRVQFAVTPQAHGVGYAFDAAGCRAHLALGRRAAHESGAWRGVRLCLRGQQQQQAG
jgi:hypothetical protein